MSRATPRQRPEVRPEDDAPPTAVEAREALVTVEVLDALVTTMHGVYRLAHLRIGRHDPRGKLTGPRLRVLFAVKEAGSLRMGDLAAQLGVAARTVTDLVDGLEKEGLLVRRPDPSDRRATLVELSPRVQARWAQMQALRREIGEEVLAPLNEAERRQLLDLLRRLKEGPLREAAARPWCEDH